MVECLWYLFVQEFGSGVICFMLEETWFVRLDYRMKIPVYALLGVSVCFALLFSLIDLINYCTTLCCQGEQSKPLVNTDQQVTIRQYNNYIVLVIVVVQQCFVSLYLIVS